MQRPRFPACGESVNERAVLSEEALVSAALAEDVGAADWTTRWTVGEGTAGRAEIVARAAGVVAGTRPAEAVFRQLERATRVRWDRVDGDRVRPGETVAEVRGELWTILTGERTVLNFLGWLSGVATLASRYVDAVRGSGCRIVDTRKTTPAWRRLEKEAVAAGGAGNHRAGLYDLVLLKENHIRAAGGIGPALDVVIGRARERGLEVEVEVTSLEELRDVLTRPPPGRPDRILLDNMPLQVLEEAVREVRSYEPPMPLLEASGGVTLDSVRRIAESGVDMISVGALTHSAPALDLSLLVRS